MAFYKINKYAHSLGYKNQFNIYIPDYIQEMESVDVVYLFHGLWGNRTDFEKYNLESYAEKYKLVLIYVEVHNSYYLNTKNGENFFNYVSFEINKDLEQMFSFKIKSKSVIGISMGGYGAMYVGIRNKFKNIANLSGSVLIDERIKNTDDNRFYNLIDDLEDEQKIDFLLQTKISSDIYSYCGTNDFLWKDNQIINELIKSNGCKYKISTDNGAHDFESWNKQMKLVFDYFFEGE